MAGNIPKNIPTTAEKAKAMAHQADIGLVELHIGDLGDAHGDELGQADPDQASYGTEYHGFNQKLGQNGRTTGAHGLAQSDLTRAFGHGHQHDIHDPDPAH